jgi:hypothetical protein
VSYSRLQIIDALENVAQIGAPSLGAATMLDIGTQEFIEYFEDEVLDNFIVQGGSTCRFFEGAYGAGKTHLLQLLRDVAVKRQMLVVEVELSHALNFVNWHSITKFILEKIQCRFDGKKFQSLPKILDAMIANGKVLEKPLRSFQLSHTGFVNAIETYLKRNRNLNPIAKDKLAQFLMGQKVGTVQLRQLGITGVKNPLSQRNAELVLNTVLSALYHLGFPGTMVLFDETEPIFKNTVASTAKTQTAANIMRRLIDTCSLSGIKGVLVSFAVLPNFIPACANSYQALGDRLMVSRPDRFKHGWRAPVLRLDTVCSISDHEEFVKAAVDKFIELARELNIHDNNLKPRLKAAGEDILTNHAGLDFRRPLIRRYASTVLEYT